MMLYNATPQATPYILLCRTYPSYIGMRDPHTPLAACLPRPDPQMEAYAACSKFYFNFR